jgi:hypothetical protein
VSGFFRFIGQGLIVVQSDIVTVYLNIYTGGASSSVCGLVAGHRGWSLRTVEDTFLDQLIRLGSVLEGVAEFVLADMIIGGYRSRR